MPIAEPAHGTTIEPVMNFGKKGILRTGQWRSLNLAATRFRKTSKSASKP